MGKIKQSKSIKQQQQQQLQQQPLHKQLQQDDDILKFGKLSNKHSNNKVDDNDFESQESSVIDPKTSSKILSLARQQQQDLDRQHLLNSLSDDDELDEDNFKLKGDDVEKDEVVEEPTNDTDTVDTNTTFKQLDINPEDEQAMNTFMPQNTSNRRTLADLILDKINAQSQPSQPPPENTLSDKVTQVYTKVGQLLSRYKSGPLPKAFKIIPSLPNWIAILQITGPESWSPHATYAATRLFASNLKANQSRLFYQHVLLDRCRDNLNDPNTKNMDVHLYDALRKSLYKPAAFFKGILFPLLESQCTLKEAAIFASVLSKTSIPVLHSAAALLHLAEMDYTGPTSLFIRVLLDKKYALPYKVLDGLVYHFMRFAKSNEKMPVLWHQSLLVFTQRYSSDLTPEQKDALLDVVKINVHPQISPEIRREIHKSTERAPGMMQDEPMAMAI